MVNVIEIEPLPEKCQDCGVQCELRADILRLLQVKTFNNMESAVIMGETGEVIDGVFDTILPEDIAADAKLNMRQSLAEDLNAVDEQIEVKQQEIRANALSCNGILKMRATRGDVSYTVGICTSPRLYKRDSGDHEHLSVHVWANSADQPK